MAAAQRADGATMIWADLLRKLWPYLAGVALLSGGALYLSHIRYEAGYAASEAKWRPAFDEATRARDAANAKARQTESDSTALSAQSEKTHAEAIASLNLRAADAAERIHALSVRIAASHSSCERLPTIPGATPVVDAAASGESRAERVGASISDTGRRCEADALNLSTLQNWLIEQRGIFTDPRPSPDVSP